MVTVKTRAFERRAHTTGCRSVWAVTLCSIWLGMAVVPTHTQSLAEVARREAERRKTVKAGRVFTAADIPTLSAPASPAGADVPRSGPTAAAAVAPEDESTTSEANRQVPVKARNKRDEQYWRSRSADYDRRLTKLRNDIGAVEGRARAISSQMPSVRTDAERRALQRERAEVDTALALLRRNRRFLEREYQDYQAFAAGKEVNPDWLRPRRR